MKTRLQEVCSSIASNFFKIGDQVECLYEKVDRHGIDLIKGSKWTIESIKGSTNGDYHYICLKDRYMGCFANCFKKIVNDQK